MNTELADIMVVNLLKNAISHNTKKGLIEIETGKNRLLISNMGAPLKIQQEKLFNRFAKDPNNKNSIGLGLAIVKKICDNYGFNIDYVYKNGLHNFIVNF